MKPSILLDLARKSVIAWIDDYAPSMGAAISYYTAFSIAPLLVIVIAVAGAVFGDEAVRGSLQSQISGLVGHEGAAAIQGLVASASEPREGAIAGTTSIVLLLVGATTVLGELQSALDRIWHVPEKDKPSGLWGLLRARFLSFSLILALAFLLMASLAVSAGIAAVGSWFGDFVPGSEVLLQLVNTVISLCISCLLFAVIYKLMPSVEIAWRDVWIGAAVTALLFEFGKFLIGLYMGKAGVGSSYAAAGALAVILIWVYYAAQVFLLGAEFTKIFAAEHGSFRQQAAAAARQANAPPAAAGAPKAAAPPARAAAPEEDGLPEPGPVATFVATAVLGLAALVLDRRRRDRRRTGGRLPARKPT
ncbi:YihY/virulence factor BrkB family protein [Xylophilus sp.]|uniref:YihY/virulence factor BrkB family protein n=1 Tax=Xylophilus sp. TaxID=2653893 RepID=UPI0013B7B948|nr:YihY/virulence factor BrkB family protein [Xylophilus sp.]KAF1049866.1 MAG: hypothetical protein GAK38_00530 [Xylophilus sp.]